MTVREDYLTVPEVAAWLRVSRATVYALCDGDDPALWNCRVGKGRGVIRVAPEAVSDYLASVERGGPGTAAGQGAPALRRLVVPDLIGQHLAGQRKARA